MHSLLQVQGATAGRGELDRLTGLEYRANSRLLLVNGIPADDDRHGAWAYRWTCVALGPQGFTPRRGSP